MASERQIAANRRNAQKSTGPRSTQGKNRSGKNAFRHGLSRPLIGAEFKRELEALVRQIVGDRKGKLAIEFARSAAEAELELARVRRLRAHLIDGFAALGQLNSAELTGSASAEAVRILREIAGAPFRRRTPKSAGGSLPPIAAEKPEKIAEAVRRVHPELERLARYESRAAARRDRAIRSLMRSDRKSV
ncbi:hypothetical protein JQ615_37845 [Bradyrhizobium jicamae]|uniref:Uncharacterized protein n=1 Tax=Bradyrhizobium jicamae TaxID=280332 RepID=A0ABS5FWH0_9BRAD|nr:hypothetical protein [Bradyrhizobium jicamae]MBR0801133.1 hypothetical protein [Bradyrhizobium jicamae]